MNLLSLQQQQQWCWLLLFLIPTTHIVTELTLAEATQIWFMTGLNVFHISPPESWRLMEHRKASGEREG